MAHILYAESHYDGAHQDWIDSYRARSAHQFSLLTMPGGDWRWRLHGGALHLANQYLARRPDLPSVDLLLINGMVSAPLFLAQTRPYLDQIPTALYIQENQLNYPATDYQWQNGAVVQALSAYTVDLVAFNGPYLKQDFLTSLADFAQERDYTDDLVERVSARSVVLRRGIDLVGRFGQPEPRPAPHKPLTFLWSHRWAYEKGVTDFAAALRQLHAEGLDFQVILAGDPWQNAPLRDALATELGQKVVGVGLLKGADYAAALRRADVMVACSLNEPLGVSMLEALYMGCFPLLPKRGSFPIMLPQQHHDLLYDGTQADLIARMRALILNPSRAYRAGLTEIAAAHDWSQVTSEYDQTFKGLIET